MANPQAFGFLALAMLFFIALFLGRLLSHIRIPRVTGYLLTGLLAGPSLAHIFNLKPILSPDIINKMQAMSDIALVLILLTIGMRFRGQFLQRWRHRIIIFSAFEIIVTSIIVAILVFFVNVFVVRHVITSIGDLIQSAYYLGLLLGIMAIATAPAATLLVIREYESDGPVTDAITTLVGLNNLVAIIGFNIFLYFILSSEASLSYLLIQIFAPVAIGAGVGFFMSVWAEKLKAVSEYQLLVLGGGIGILALCKILGYDFMLGCIACGIVLANSSPKVDEILSALKKFDYALYVIFFVLAGAALHIEALFHIGIIGIVYVIARTAGKLIGCYLGAKVGKFSETEQHWSGFTMLAQAGVAIGLCQALLNLNAPDAKYISTVVFGSVVIFELIGPISVRFGLIRAGEVPVLTMLAKKAPVGSFEGLHHVIDHFRTSIALPEGHKVKSAQDILVKHIMRKNVDTIRDNTPLNEMLRLIAHSRYDRFPIVNREGKFVGVIDYEDIRDVLFDQTLSYLVVAHDLVKKVALVTYPNSTLGDVLKVFYKYKDISYLPVVDELEIDKLLGMVSQNDVLAAFRKFNKK
ncbi:cation:proton antiporter [candidate division KSB1 bacterium]|nr:cation:proton antiporter [candidate division KSB1 bacterium]